MAASTLSTRASSSHEAAVIISELRSDLNAALDLIEDQRRSGGDSVELQGHLNDYAIVRMAGYLEQLCFQAISGRIGQVATGPLQSFVSSWFYKSPNLNPVQFRELFGRFGPEAKEELSAFFDSGLNGELLKSLLEIRNNVAHGKEGGAGSRSNVQTYRRLIDDIEDLVFRLLLDEVPVL